MTSLYEMGRLAGEYEDELFARGYIVSKRLPTCPSGWNEANFGDYLIAHHPSLPISYAENAGATLLCLGLIFDARHPELDQDGYVEQLRDALCRSESQMLDLLSHSNGRFVLLYQRAGERPYLVQDATGMRGALYHCGPQVTVSSHLKLLELDVASAEARDDRSFRFGFPGRLTPVQNVRFLTPNTKLSLEDGSIQRFWPTASVESLSLEAAADEVADLLASSFEWIDRRFDHFATVTAGLDSRVTLSVIKAATRYATYYRNDTVDTDKVDLETTQQIARALGIDHTVLGPETREGIPESFKSTVRFNTFRRHIPGMAWAYREEMVRDPETTIHIRSNLSEIGRMFYQGRGSNPRDGRDLNTLWSTKAELRNDANAAAFQEFADATGFFDTPVEHSSLFYWEHRMGSWHSQVPLESDIACETLSLYNCRRLLAAMWSVSEHAQKKSLLLKRIVATRWPSLTTFRLNGRPFDPSAPDDREEVFRGVTVPPALTVV